MPTVNSRRHHRAMAIVLALISTIAIVSPLLAKTGGNATAAAACRAGGYLNWTDAVGSSFANPGACVRYAAHGGTLVPVAAGPFSVVYSAPVGIGSFGATITGTGLEPSSPVTFAFVWPARSVTASFLAEPDGTVSFVHGELCTDIDGENMTSLTATGTPAGGVPTSYPLPLPPPSICP